MPLLWYGEVKRASRLADNLNRRLESRAGSADLRDLKDAHSLARILHRLDQRELYLFERNQAQTECAVTGPGELLEQSVHRPERIGPAVSRTEHVPGAEHRRVQAALANHGFAFGSYLDVGLHHRCRLRDG
jgi:hypothetical protein